jgi:hypothetical protein
VTVFVDGRPLAAYAGAYLRNGRVYAPIDPLVLQVADRVWFEPGALIVERGQRRIRIPLHAGFTEEPAIGYLAIGPLLRALGDRVAYDGAHRRLEVESPPQRRPAATPTPFVPTVQASRAVFTPDPVPTARPVWSGPPLPRRTPLPAPSVPGPKRS